MKVMMSHEIVKDEIRLLGVDDASFEFSQDQSYLIGSIFRGGKFLEGLIIKQITVDGFDVNDKIIAMINKSRHGSQINTILLDGITFAGFNIAQLRKIASATGRGVVAVSRKEPDLKRVKRALKHVNESEKRLDMIEAAGQAKELRLEQGNVYFQHQGVTEDKARQILQLSATRSLIPEPIRVSHMIGSALVEGETKGRV